MEVIYNSHKLQKVVETKEIKVPYYAFGSRRKETAVCIVENQEHNEFLNTDEKKAKYSRFKVILVRTGFDSAKRIEKFKHGVEFLEFDKEFMTLYRDYDIEMTKEEFDKFLEEVFEEIKK